MKRILIAILLFALSLFGCSASESPVDKAIDFRNQLLNSKGCSFDATVTVDYTDMQFTFDLFCISDPNGDISFRVISPDTIQGITGIISGDSGKFTFDNETLLFPLLIEGAISPVAAPWLLVKSLRSGYISGCVQSENGLEIHIDDTYEDHNLMIIVRTDTEGKPVASDIFWNSQGILSLKIENYKIL